MRLLSKNRNAILILSIIAGAAIILAVISYRYSVSTSNQILSIAAADIWSNAIMEAHDLSQSLENKLKTITANLQTISSAHSVQTGSELIAKPILDAAQMSTASITDGYYWLDSKGNIVTHSGNSLDHIGLVCLSHIILNRYTSFRIYQANNISEYEIVF